MIAAPSHDGWVRLPVGRHPDITKKLSTILDAFLGQERFFLYQDLSRCKYNTGISINEAGTQSSVPASFRSVLMLYFANFSVLVPAVEVAVAT